MNNPESTNFSFFSNNNRNTFDSLYQNYNNYNDSGYYNNQINQNNNNEQSSVHRNNLRNDVNSYFNDISGNQVIENNNLTWGTRRYYFQNNGNRLSSIDISGNIRYFENNTNSNNSHSNQSPENNNVNNVNDNSPELENNRQVPSIDLGISRDNYNNIEERVNNLFNYTFSDRMRNNRLNTRINRMNRFNRFNNGLNGFNNRLNRTQSDNFYDFRIPYRLNRSNVGVPLTNNSYLSWLNQRNPIFTYEAEIIHGNENIDVSGTIADIINEVQRYFNLRDDVSSTDGLSLNTLYNNSTIEVADESIINDEDNVCVICLREFQQRDVIRRFNTCSHYFHSHCVERWLCNHTFCPTCRGNINVDLSSENQNSNSSTEHSEESEDRGENLEESNTDSISVELNDDGDS